MLYICRRASYRPSSKEYQVKSFLLNGCLTSKPACNLTDAIQLQTWLGESRLWSPSMYPTSCERNFEIMEIVNCVGGTVVRLASDSIMVRLKFERMALWWLETDLNGESMQRQSFLGIPATWHRRHQKHVSEVEEVEFLVSSHRGRNLWNMFFAKVSVCTSSCEYAVHSSSRIGTRTNFEMQASDVLYGPSSS